MQLPAAAYSLDSLALPFAYRSQLNSQYNLVAWITLVLLSDQFKSKAFIILIGQSKLFKENFYVIDLRILLFSELQQ